MKDPALPALVASASRAHTSRSATFPPSQSHHQPAAPGGNSDISFAYSSEDERRARAQVDYSRGRAAGGWRSAPHAGGTQGHLGELRLNRR